MKILYICEKPSAGKLLAKNMVALNLSGEFEDHDDYLESTYKHTHVWFRAP